jgi:hypothetical protein
MPWMTELTLLGGGICASFVVFGALSVICYKPWRRRVERKRPISRVDEAACGLRENNMNRPDEEAAGIPSQFKGPELVEHLLEDHQCFSLDAIEEAP